MENSEFFDKNHGLTPMEKYKFWAFFKSMFFYSELRLLFLLELHQTLFINFALKHKMEKSHFFDKNRGLNPSEKCKF